MGITRPTVYEFIKMLKQYPNIKVEGVYTHLSSADYDDEYTKKQLQIFLKEVEEISNKCDTINYEIMSTIASRVPRIFTKE